MILHTDLDSAYHITLWPLFGAAFCGDVAEPLAGENRPFTGTNQLLVDN